MRKYMAFICLCVISMGLHYVYCFVTLLIVYYKYF